MKGKTWGKKKSYCYKGVTTTADVIFFKKHPISSCQPCVLHIDYVPRLSQTGIKHSNTILSHGKC